MIGHQPLELIAGILVASVGNDAAAHRACPADRSPSPEHPRRVTQSWSCSRPADDTTREQIDDGRHIEPTFCRPHVGEVSDPSTIGCGRFEAAIEHVRSDRRSLPLPQISRQATPSRRVLRACNRINRSIRCRPYDTSSASMSCHTRLTQYVRSLAKKLVRIFAPSSSSVRLR